MKAAGGEFNLARVVNDLLTVGCASFAVEDELRLASQKALATGRRTLSRTDSKEQLVTWSGNGMWSGYQPLPEGDPQHIDMVERYEMPAAALKAALNPSGPALAPEGELHAALRAAHDRSIDLIGRLIATAAATRGHAEDKTRSLWLEDHESTTVVNYYPPLLLDPIAMKAHRDFGGLTIIFFEPGKAGALDIHDGNDWRAIPPDACACAIVGELLAGWLGCTPPLHRVRSTAVPRTSLVVFHQPAFDRTVRFKDGSLVNAGQHIAARQAEYNMLDGRYR
ncbi:2OG-Fe(II) oxygenase family protein [Paraburkholderia domus]|uniref:2OG-Fe(II) oxygenase family protein n=1 Tax=Paraburkholderia domus TaxID=2793075 RepID=UPI001B204FFA|nr:2OG-Fe(II) oxygenase family protein [Paraburkholderia domus]CAE6851453.1 hypothetical protein R75483_07620 [Paraburkholderia domus]